MSLSTPLFGSPLHGSKVSLRPFDKCDITLEYINWLNNPKVVQYSNQRFRIHTLESSMHYLSTFDWESSYLLAICSLVTGLHLGTLTIYRNLNHGTADVGILLGAPQSWGQGLGQDAFRIVVRTLKESLQVRKVTAGTMAENKAMVGILESTGFRLEAVRSAQEIFEGRPVDLLYYAQFLNT